VMSVTERNISTNEFEQASFTNAPFMSGLSVAALPWQVHICYWLRFVALNHFSTSFLSSFAVTIVACFWQPRDRHSPM
jgi:hypothetical protein